MRGEVSSSSFDSFFPQPEKSWVEWQRGNDVPPVPKLSAQNLSTQKFSQQFQGTFQSETHSNTLPEENS